MERRIGRKVTRQGQMIPMLISSMDHMVNGVKFQVISVWLTEEALIIRMILMTHTLEITDVSLILFVLDDHVHSRR